MVMIAAPHTSNWDFMYARAAFYLMGIPLRFTIKKELFFFPLGPILRAFGGIAIDRSKSGGMVGHMIELYEERDELFILVTPEGTRSYAREWKKGFYHVAEGAGVPICCGYLDYAKKIAGIGPTIHPSGDYEKDLEIIQDFYRGVTAKYPEQGVR
ncbi:MAG: glycerol acyltransferase [Flavobacteriales bacterium]|nr:glycerol acyltransferase [Flavobacteriales bacterium]